MNSDVAKLLARLMALKNNLPKNPVPDKYANEFNEIVLGLERVSNGKLDEFKIPSSEIKPIMVSFNYLTGGEREYSSEKYCQREYLLMKIDGISGYFTLLLEPTEIKSKLGFDVEENK